jgi:hypothetical protein
MKREFLKDLGIADEVIDKVMGEHGRDIEARKGEAEQFKTQLAEVQKKLAAFGDADVDGLKGSIEKLKADLEAEKTRHQQETEERDFTETVRDVASRYKFRKTEAALPFIDVESLKKSKNIKEDADKAFAKLAADEPWLTEQETPKRVVAKTTGATGEPEDKGRVNDALKALYGKR